jgi:N6-L-threonylcarbamoyladenine synthase
MKILGIETSCDDTGIALIDGKKVLYNKIFKQHHEFGVIPENAARDHFDAIKKNIKEIEKPDLIAYTNGPGLIGSLFVGASFAKALAYSFGIPSIAINHLEAHVMLPYWLYEFEMPFVCLLISGGHTMLVFVRRLGDYEVISRTMDDAVGEMLDKVARNMGLAYPGGIEIEKLAKAADFQEKFVFPVPVKNSDDFSFSGLKTAAIRQICADDTTEKKANFCFYFQEHVGNLLAEKLARVAKKYEVKNWVISGGVAANKTIRRKIEEVGVANVFYPEIEICTDNGLMIAALASLRFPKFGATSLNIRCDAGWKM